MKSAYERALEKFGGIREMDEGKKKRIAEIDRMYMSKIVGLELSYQDKIDAANTEDERGKLRHFMHGEIESLNEKAEKEKEGVRCD